MSFAKEAWVFVFPPALLAVLLLWAGRSKPALALFVLAGLVLLFFRIPRRGSNASLTSILAPANGRVTQVDVVEDPQLGEGQFQRVVTFLSVFDVHVQRSPVAGRVVQSRYTSGRKVAAFREDAGELNEQILTAIECENGDLIGIRQIAGLVARRVVTYLELEETVDRGQVIGLIKFSSRVDLILPLSYDLQVEVGQRLTEGSTVVAIRQGNTNE